MSTGTENVIRAAEDMESHLRELDTCDAARVEAIGKDASACNDLMNYSYEVADTGSDNWQRLDTLVGKVLAKVARRLGKA